MYARQGMGEGGSWCGSWPWEYLCSDAANKAASVPPKPPVEYGDIRDRNAVGLILCKFAPWDQRCMPAPVSADDQTNYGGQLNQAARDAAQSMYQKTVTDDCASHPENYTQIPGSCSYKDPADFTTVALVIAGVAAFMLLKN